MKKVLAITLLALTLALVNCKDNSTTDPTPKTLNKILMVNKYWKTTAAPILSHYFRSDGKYYLPDGISEEGTWQWLNNSDSLEVVETTFGRTVWYVEYCTDTELKMKGKGDKYGYVFTKQ